MQEKFVESKVNEPDTQSWYDYIWQAEQETPNRLEDAAKQLATMISLSLAIFLAVGENYFKNIRGNGWLIMALVLWLLSLLFSFWVLSPYPYRYAGRSVQSIKAMHQKIVQKKYRLLLASFTLYLAALIILSLFFFL